MHVYTHTFTSLSKPKTNTLKHTHTHVYVSLLVAHLQGGDEFVAVGVVHFLHARLAQDALVGFSVFLVCETGWGWW